MRSASPSVDWQFFWLLEAVFLGVPALVAVMAFREGSTLPPHRVEMLALIWMGLTLLNLIVLKIRTSHTARPKS